MKTSILALSLIAVIFLSGCVGTDDSCADDSCTVSAPKNFRLLVSDEEAVISEFDSVTVTITDAVIKPKSGEQITQTIGKEVDLSKLQGELTYPIVNADLALGEYEWIKLSVSKIEATKNGTAVEIKLPGEELKIMKGFTISNETTNFIFDISLVAKGNGEYNLKPVISESGVVGKDISSDKVKECDKDGKNCKDSEVEDEETSEEPEQKVTGDDCTGVTSGYSECCDQFYAEEKEDCATGKWMSLKGKCTWDCEDDENTNSSDEEE